MGNNPSFYTGHRVLETAAGSPGSEANLVPYLDVIVSVNEVELDNKENSLVSVIRTCVDKRTSIKIYNCKTRKYRNAEITPRKGWGGAGVLGLVARYDAYSPQFDSVLHVIAVLPGSPAEQAGLRPTEDYILGAEKQTFKDVEHFKEFCANRKGKKSRDFCVPCTDRYCTPRTDASWGLGSGLPCGSS
jgi:C-terminal processing protease CtpA/Prc